MRISIAATLLFISFYTSAQSNETLDTSGITEILYQATDDNSPGMAVGIIKDGIILYERYIGKADLAHSIDITRNTRFNIASNAKQFTAFCILKLQEEGKLSLDDDMRKYLPDLYPNIEDSITILNLITHTSGIRDYCDLCAIRGEAWWKQFIDNDDALEMIQDQHDLNFKPGSDFLYSNSNYIVLAEIIKQVSGQSFSDYAKSTFTELGMPNTAFRIQYAEVVPNQARPYGNWGVWREEPTITEVHGDGALFTTLPDQLQWEKIIQQNDGGYASKELINESQSLPENTIESTYGYGLDFRNNLDLAYTFHDGVTGAYNATFLRFPTENMAVVVMCNNRNMSANYVAWQIAYNFLNLEVPQRPMVYPAQPKKIEKLKHQKDLTGIYKGVADGTVIQIIEKNDTLYREMYQRDPVQLSNETGGLFTYPENFNGLKMNFTNVGKPDQQFTIYRSDLEPSSYQKVSDLAFSGYDKTQLNGRFYNDENNVEIILDFNGENALTVTKAGRAREATLVAPDYIRMMSSYEIIVIRNQANEVVGLSVSNNRARNLLFTKSN